MKIIDDLLDTLKRKLLTYKKNVQVRVIVVIGISILVCLIASKDYKSVMVSLQYTMAIPIIIGMFEYMTLNVIFDKEFYPLDMFADQVFPNRDSFGYKALYIGYYVIFWCGVFYFFLS